MRLSEIDQKARQLGITDYWRFTKRELIQEIQKFEGNNPCFQSGIRNCPQMGCSWRPDCQR